MGLLASLALGLSLAVLPVLLTWTTALGLHWTRQSAWFAAGALAALAIWRAWAKRPASAGLPLPKISTASLALLGIFAVTIFARFVMVRDLAAPPWVDSIHHGVITRLLLDQGAFPASYAPYLEIDTARYHAGFHAGLAFFIWLSGLEMHSAMLIYGQVLNALIVFPAYLLTVQLTGSRRAGLFAALIAGLFTPMPAYYTSWGRYTQLAGLIILPAAFALCRLPQPQAALKLWRPVQIFLAAIACAGLFLTHYRVAAFLACLLAADWLVAALPALALRLNTSRLRLPAQPDNGSPGKGSPLRALAQLLLTAGLSLLLVLPWLPETFATLFIPKLSLWQGGNPEPFSGFAWSFLDTAWGKPAMALAALGLILGVVQRQSHPWVLALWAGLMLLLANLEPLGLPGGGFVTTLSVTISAFLPIAVAGGAFLDGVYNAGASLFSRLAHIVSRKIPSPEEEPAPARHGEEAHASEAGAATEAIPGVSPSRAGLSQVSPGSPPRQNNWLYAACWTAAALIAALFAARAQVTLLRPVTFLARQADFTAIRWAAANLPAGATALVNPAGWGYGLFQGEDGGYWLSPLAGIQTLPPPVIYGLDNNLERVGQVNSLVQAALDAAADPPALHRLLQENDIAYIFIGAKGGAFPASRLLESGLFQVLYHQDGAWIFQPAKIHPANAPY